MALFQRYQGDIERCYARAMKAFLNVRTKLPNEPISSSPTKYLSEAEQAGLPNELPAPCSEPPTSHTATDESPSEQPAQPVIATGETTTNLYSDTRTDSTRTCAFNAPDVGPAKPNECASEPVIFRQASPSAADEKPKMTSETLLAGSLHESTECDHVRLLRLAEELDGALGTAAACSIAEQLFQDLCRQTREHFEWEEREMQQHGYPDAHRHIRQHQEALAWLARISHRPYSKKPPFMA